MELSHDHMPESLYNLQQTSESITNSDLSLIASQVKSSPSVTSVTTAVPSNLANLGNKSEQERKKMKTDSVTDADDEDEVETYMVSDHLTEVNKVIGREESNGKFGKVSETLQKLEASKQQQLTATTETTSIIPAAKFSQKQMKNQADPDYIFEEFDDRERKYTVTENEFLVSTGNMFSGTDKNIFSVIWTNNEVVSSAAITNQQLQATGQKEITALTCPDDFNCSSGSASVQRLNYTPEISLMEVISNVTENLIETLEKSDVSQVKSQNEQEILFEKYANFEPPSCRLQRVPEFDAVPLSMEQLLSKSRLQFQMFPAESKIPDQTRYREYISDSTKKVQEITKKMNSCKAVSESFPGIIHSSSEQTGLKAVGSTDISTVQIELIAESDFQQRNQPLLTPDSISLISPFSQVIASNLEITTPFRTDQDPVITKFETNEYIASEQKIEKKNSVIKSKPVLKGTFDKTESSFTRNNSREEMKLNSFTVVPEMKQISLLRSQTAPPCPPPRQRLNKPTSVSSRSLLPRRSKHFFMKSKKPVEASAFEANFTLSGCDDKKPDFTISKIYQASSSQETRLLDISKEMKSELEKFWNDAIYEEQQRRSKISSGTIWDLENK